MIPDGSAEHSYVRRMEGDPTTLVLIIVIVMLVLTLGSVVSALVAVMIELAKVGVVLLVVIALLIMVVAGDGCSSQDGGVRISFPERFGSSPNR